MEEVKIDWDLMQLYMKILRLKNSFAESKKEYEEFIFKCEQSIVECEIMLKEIDALARTRKV